MNYFLSLRSPLPGGFYSLKSGKVCMHVTNPLRLTKRQYSILGRLCANQMPDKSRELLSIFNVKPIEQDHSRIGQFFLSFCQIHNVNPDDYRGSLFKSTKSDQRRLFVACMVRMYLPHLYVAPRGSVRLDYGFTQSLATALRLKRQNLTKMVREVVVQERAYTEFRAAVDEITNKLKST